MDEPHRTPPRPLSDAELGRMDAWWRAANYLAVGQIYLLDNPLLDAPRRASSSSPRARTGRSRARCAGCSGADRPERRAAHPATAVPSQATRPIDATP
jgi:hypothetical protein